MPCRSAGLICRQTNGKLVARRTMIDKTMARSLLAVAVLEVMLAGTAVAGFIPPDLLAGSEYQVMFVTSSGTTPISSNIADYNSFVQGQAALDSSLPAATWTAVASTPSFNAINASATSGFPVYDTHGDLLASGYAALFATGSYGPQYDENGNPTQFQLAWTGTTGSGVASSHPLGSALSGVGSVTGGYISDAWPTWLKDTSFDNIDVLPLFAISSPITVPKPPTIAVWASPVIGNWNSADNWTGGMVPNAAGAGAVFSASATAAVTITLGTPQTVGTLQFANSGNASLGYILSGSGSNTLTLNDSGSARRSRSPAAVTPSTRRWYWPATSW